MNKQYYYDCISKGIALYWETLAKARGLKLISKDIKYVISENRNGPERIFDVNLQSEKAVQRIEELTTFIKAGEIPDSFLLTPNSKPKNLTDLLEEKGFNIDTSGLCMAMDLVELKPFQHEISDFEVIKFKDVSALRNWVDIINTDLFGFQIMTFEQFYDIYNLDNTQFYLGLYNGIPVSTSMTISKGKIAVLEMVATRKDYRKKGFALAVINEALFDLQKRRIETISLRAEPDGINLYKKIGFKEYCKRIVAQ